MATGAAAVAAGVAIVLVALAVRPSGWTVVGHSQSVLMESRNSAELYDLEAMNLAYVGGIEANAGRLAAASARLRGAIWAALCVPVIALVAGSLYWLVSVTAVPA